MYTVASNETSVKQMQCREDTATHWRKS